MAHKHVHSDRQSLRAAQKSTLWTVLILNAAFMVAEGIAGVVFGSLALIADAVHTLSDVAALGIALAAQALLTRPPTRRHSYGLQRAEILGALVNGVILLLVGGWITLEAIDRLGDPGEVEGVGLLAVALLGLSINLGSVVLISRRRAHSLNMQGAYIHMLVDAAGSLAAVIAGVAVIGWGADFVDPLVSLAIVGLIGWSVWHLLSETMHVLLEGVPRHLDPEQVEGALTEDAHIESVHHLHIWSLASDTPALSAHVVLKGEMTLHDAQGHGDRLRLMLLERFGIDHATIELECHACE